MQFGPFDGQIPVGLQNVVVILSRDLGESEITNFNAIVLGNENISRCQISMNDIFSAQVVHTGWYVQSKTQ